MAQYLASFIWTLPQRTIMDCWHKKTVLEKKSIVALSISLILIIAIITLIEVLPEHNYCETPSCIKTAQHISRLIDFSQNPCKNFYAFACGNFVGHSHKSVIDSERNSSFERLKAIVLEPIKVNDTKSLRLQKRFYQSCTDTTRIDKDNDTSFWALITKLGGWPVVNGNEWDESAFDFVELMVNLRKAGLPHDWFLDISVYSNVGSSTVLEINVPDNANKIEDKMKQSYVEVMTEIAMAFGAHEHLAKLEMEQVLFFENKLADLVEEINYQNELLHKDGSVKLMTIAEIQIIWQKINWLELFNQITNKKLSENQQVAFFAESYLPKLDKILRITRKRTQVNYVIWKLVEAYSPLLSKKVRDLIANYQSLTTSKLPQWYQDRDNYCFDESKSFFQYSLDAEYMRRYVSRQKRQKVAEMVKRILVQLEKHISTAKWMDNQTKNAAIRRLQNISYIIGGPEEMYDIKQFDKYIGVGNMDFDSSNIIDIMTEIRMKELDSAYDKKHGNYLKYAFYELVPTLETRFLRDYNLLYIPSGILHELFYDENRPQYLNYGIIGTIIGHELMQGFNTGYFGNSTWWSNSTFENFGSASKCLLNCTDGLEENHLEISCYDTLLENMADYTSINLAYEAYQKWVKDNGVESAHLAGLEFSNNQLFWLAYGSLMCHVPVIELNYNYNYMLPSYRIIGSFRNSFHFSEDFNCELGTNMNPPNKCQIL